MKIFPAKQLLIGFLLFSTLFLLSTKSHAVRGYRGCGSAAEVLLVQESQRQTGWLNKHSEHFKWNLLPQAPRFENWGAEEIGDFQYFGLDIPRDKVLKILDLAIFEMQIGSVNSAFPARQYYQHVPKLKDLHRSIRENESYEFSRQELGFVVTYLQKAADIHGLLQPPQRVGRYRLPHATHARH